jgi:xanthine/uracil/vitamin C permease (AzgA family)
VVAILFLLALFFSPLAGMIPAYATAAALLYVAVVMAKGLADVDWKDMTEYAPAVVTALAMPFTYSIATGIGLGFITYAVLKILSGQVAGRKPRGARAGRPVRGLFRGALKTFLPRLRGEGRRSRLIVMAGPHGTCASRP